jgi:hypothetical protein
MCARAPAAVEPEVLEVHEAGERGAPERHYGRDAGRQERDPDDDESPDARDAWVFGVVMGPRCGQVSIVVMAGDGALHRRLPAEGPIH